VLAEALSTAEDAIAASAARSARRALAVAERVAAAGVTLDEAATRIATLRRRVEGLA
jgi:hypothetical protein